MYIVKQAKKTLSSRELQILHLVCYGSTVSMMAHILEIKESTVKTYIERLYLKLGVRNRAGAVMEAAKRGLLP